MTARDRRALLLGILIVGVSWVTLRGVPAALTFVARAEERIEQHNLLIERARARLSRLDQLDDSIKALEDVAESLPDALLVGEDRETASVDLMRRIRALTSDRPVTLEEFRSDAAPDSIAELALASLTVRIESDLRGLLEVLAEIERYRALGLESVDIEAVDPHAESDVPERLRATMSVSGWFRPEAGATHEPPVSFVR